MNKRLLKNKKFLATLVLSAALLLTGCNSNKTEDVNTGTPVESQADNNETATNTDAITTENNAEFIELNIDDNASIEHFVDETYNQYYDFYSTYGISKDQIRDIVFVLNDKYTDEDGKLVIDEDKALEAYANIKVIEGQSDDSITQKIDNINYIEDAIAHPEDEKAQEIAAEIDANNNWKIEVHPTLVPLFDKNVSGGQAAIEKVSKWEEERDFQIEVLNTYTYGDSESINRCRESINNYVINQEITEYNNDTNNTNKVNRNGQKFAVAVANFTALNIAAKENPYTIYLEGYNAIDENIKINPTDEERFLENDIITLVNEGLIDATTANSIIEESKSYVKLGYSVTEIEEILHEKYTIDDAKLRLLVSYANYLTTMANDKYLDVECDEEAETYDDINIKRNNYNDVKITGKVIYTLHI